MAAIPSARDVDTERRDATRPAQNYTNVRRTSSPRISMGGGGIFLVLALRDAMHAKGVSAGGCQVDHIIL